MLSGFPDLTFATNCYAIGQISTGNDENRDSLGVFAPGSIVIVQAKIFLNLLPSYYLRFIGLERGNGGGKAGDKFGLITALAIANKIGVQVWLAFFR